MTKEQSFYSDPAHPNYSRWKKAREISEKRGSFVKSVLQNELNCSRLTILDLGSGEGGTSLVLSEDNIVISADLNKERLTSQYYSSKISKIIADASALPFKEESFNLIVLQDVIEHLPDPEIPANKFSCILKDNGKIFISTPNRLSIINFLSDPHWGLPVLSVLKRKQIKKFFLKFFRKKDYNRQDIAELLSLDKLKSLFERNFKLKLYTKYAVSCLLNGGEGIIWSSFHLKMINFISKLKLSGLINNCANDKIGFVNKYITPTFYLLLTKRNNTEK